jgi:uncharacterized surface protein with fasciclin (FAS1) repeats
MRIRKLLIAAMTTAAITAGALATTAPAQAQTADPTLADILQAQGGGTDRDWYDFDILAAGVDAAGLTDALDDPSADLTVFLPNDRAFQALVVDLYGFRYWFKDEATILNKLVELETSAPGTLQTVILYHAVPGQIPSSAALAVKPGTELTSLQGGTIRVFPFFGTAILGDQDRNDFDPFLVKSKLDIQASNGIGHGIGLVLRPADL